MRNEHLLSNLVTGLAFCIGFIPQAQAQSPASPEFQASRIGGNSFVSSPGGQVYLILDKGLYRNKSNQVDAWDQLGSEIITFAVDPHNENVLYAVNSQNIIMKSLDIGRNWMVLNPGFNYGPVLTILVNPVNSQDVFLGTASGLIETTDAGFSWHTTSFVLPVNQLYINPHSPTNQYLLSAGIIFCSSDSGHSWKPSNAGLPVEIVRGAGRTASKIPVSVSMLIFVNWQKPFLLAATFHKGVFRSDDDGTSWKPSGSGLDPSKGYMTASVGRSRVVLASADSLYESKDGSNWARMPIKSGRNTATSYVGVIEYPKQERLLLVFRFTQDTGEPLRVGFIDPKGVLVGLNYGVLPHSEVHSVWTTRMNGRPAIFAVTSDRYNVDAINVQPGEFAKYLSVSADDGYSWELIGKEECGDRSAMPKGIESDVWVYGKGKDCIVRTQDGGVTWQDAPADTREWQTDVSRLIVDPTDRNLIYYCTGVNEHYVYRFKYDPETRRGQSLDLKVQASDILVDENNHLALYTNKGMLSTDGGWTWTDKLSLLERSLGTLPVLSNRTVNLVSFSSGEIRAVVGEFDRINSTGNIKIIRSTDSGTTWQQVAIMTSRVPQFYMQWPEIFQNNQDSANFFIVVYMSSQARGSNIIKLLETRDGGQTWHDIYSREITSDDAQHAGEIIRSVAQIRKEEKREIVIGGVYGLWTSTDEGATWKRIGGLQ
jgi:photosystem II stability/assembly factor-like uncharacterized protein